MKYSIIIPVYNVEKYIPRCLESVVKQTYKDYEIIIVNDGSTDGSYDICKQYEDKYSNIILVNQDNKGLSGARNAGLERASGEWIIFVDSDDWISTEMLQIVDGELKKNKVDLLSFNTYIVGDDYEIKRKQLYLAESQNYYFYNEKDKFDFMHDYFLKYKLGWEVCFRVYKKSIIDKYNLRFVSSRDVFAEDLLFTFQYMLFIRKYRHICNILYYYYQRDDSLIHSVDLSSVIKRLINLSLEVFKLVEKYKFKYIKKNFHELFFILINHHYQFMLVELPDKKDILIREAKDKNPKKWTKKILRNRKVYDIYMENIRWI